MTAHTSLVLKDTFAPRFASIQAMLDSVDFLEINEVIFYEIFMFLLLYIIFKFFLCSVHTL